MHIHPQLPIPSSCMTIKLVVSLSKGKRGGKKARGKEIATCEQRIFTGETHIGLHPASVEGVAGCEPQTR